MRPPCKASLTHSKASQHVHTHATLLRALPPHHAVCGNGMVEDEEECDDGNRITGDGCSDSCKDEVDDVNCAIPTTIVDVAVAAYGAENTWKIDSREWEGPYKSDTEHVVEFCLRPGIHTLHYRDAYGDGWHGGTIAVRNHIEAIAPDGSGSEVTFRVASPDCTVPTVSAGVASWSGAGCDSGATGIEPGTVCSIAALPDYVCTSPGLCQGGSFAAPAQCRLKECKQSTLEAVGYATLPVCEDTRVGSVACSVLPTCAQGLLAGAAARLRVGLGKA